MAGVKTVFDDIKQSQEDKRAYRGLLLSNGLKALLISDPTTDKSSAALKVGVGNMSDPPGLPGLAHFCEHMLFLGTKKYPDEQEYNRFLSEHGGSSNASTNSDSTTYYFDVAPDGLPGALDRFAQFFTCPLFTASATDREVNAVNSENEKNIQMDSRRLYQVEKVTYDQSHPYTHFGTGNKDTLMTRPLQEGVDTREALLTFHKRYYSANIMTLTVLGKETLSELETLVTELFAGVENKDVLVEDWTGHPLTPKQTQRQLSIVPVKNLRGLKVEWPLSDYKKHYKSKPSGYLSHLLGHEGSGSIYSEIRKRGWATQLTAGGRTYHGFAFFTMSIDLSEEGLEHTTDIMTLIFQYINMLMDAAPQEWIHRERQELNEMRFRFKDKEQPRTYTVNCVSHLQDYPIPEVLSAPMLIEEYKPEVITEMLSHLRPDNCRIVVSTKKFEGETEQTDPWYGVPYSDLPLDGSIVKEWMNCGLHSSLHLPTKNEFIPTNFELLTRDEKASPSPRLVEKTALSELWYRQDNEFLLPKAYINVSLFSRAVYSDVVSMNLAAMFERMFLDSLNEYLYAASLADLYYDLIVQRHGFKVALGGYNDKLKVLLQKLMDRVVNMEVDADRFAVLKEKYIRSLENHEANQPYSHASYYMDLFLTDVMWTVRQKLAQAHSMTPDDLTAFRPRLLSNLYAKILAYGNLDKEVALEMSHIVRTTLESAGTVPLPADRHPQSHTVQFSDDTWQALREANRVHATQAIKVYYQVGWKETAPNMLLELLAQINKQPCFDTLRTKEQLGYIVFSGVTRQYGVQGFYVTVQSIRTPEFLETRVDLYLSGLHAHMVAMPDDVFENHKEALASRRLEKAKKLWEQHGRYQAEISTNVYMFDRGGSSYVLPVVPIVLRGKVYLVGTWIILQLYQDEVEVAYLRTITKDQVIEFYNTYIAEKGSMRRKLSIYIPSGAATDAAETGSDATADPAAGSPLAVTVRTLDDLSAFKTTLPLYPYPSPATPLTVEQ